MALDPEAIKSIASAIEAALNKAENERMVSRQELTMFSRVRRSLAETI
jgi:hypothetical protein